jgi:hypothetical protein
MKSWLTGHLGCTVAHGDVADKDGLSAQAWVSMGFSRNNWSYFASSTGIAEA